MKWTGRYAGCEKTAPKTHCFMDSGCAHNPSPSTPRGKRRGAMARAVKAELNRRLKDKR